MRKVGVRLELVSDGRLSTWTVSRRSTKRRRSARFADYVVCGLALAGFLLLGAVVVGWYPFSRIVLGI